MMPAGRCGRCTLTSLTGARTGGSRSGTRRSSSRSAGNSVPLARRPQDQQRRRATPRLAQAPAAGPPRPRRGSRPRRRRRAGLGRGRSPRSSPPRAEGQQAPAGQRLLRRPQRQGPARRHHRALARAAPPHAAAPRPRAPRAATTRARRPVRAPPLAAMRPPPPGVTARGQRRRGIAPAPRALATLTATGRALIDRGEELWPFVTDLCVRYRLFVKNFKFFFPALSAGA